MGRVPGGGTAPVEGRRLRRRLITVLTAVTVGICGTATGVMTGPGAATSDNGQSIRRAMGWSTWSFVRRWPDETKMKAQADALAASGLPAHGFIYINLDDFYQKCDSNGFMVDSFGRWQV